MDGLVAPAHFHVTTRWIESQQRLGLPHMHMLGINRYHVTEVEAWLGERYGTSREQKDSEMPLNQGTRNKPRYCGYVKYRGRKSGSTPSTTLRNNIEKARCLAELQEEVNNPHSQRRRSITVAEFAGATFHENGLITMTWPDGERCQKETGPRDSTVRRLRDGLRLFIRSFTTGLSTASLVTNR